MLSAACLYYKQNIAIHYADKETIVMACPGVSSSSPMLHLGHVGGSLTKEDHYVSLKKKCIENAIQVDTISMNDEAKMEEAETGECSSEPSETKSTEQVEMNNENTADQNSEQRKGKKNDFVHFRMNGC